MAVSKRWSSCMPTKESWINNLCSGERAAGPDGRAEQDGGDRAQQERSYFGPARRAAADSGSYHAGGKELRIQNGRLRDSRRGARICAGELSGPAGTIMEEDQSMCCNGGGALAGTTLWTGGGGRTRPRWRCRVAGGIGGSYFGETNLLRHQHLSDFTHLSAIISAK